MTSEYIAQMGPMLAVAGAMVAWLAQLSSTTRARGHGFMPDMVIGLLGSMLAGALLWAASAVAHSGMLAMFGVGALGAGLAIASQRRLFAVGLAR